MLDYEDLINDRVSSEEERNFVMAIRAMDMILSIKIEEDDRKYTLMPETAMGLSCAEIWRTHIVDNMTAELCTWYGLVLVSLMERVRDFPEIATDVWEERIQMVEDLMEK